jgi:mitotic spindle assembly checkpoint protein MAD2
MIITNVNTNECLECWDFKVESEPSSENDDPNSTNEPKSSKELKKIQSEIQAVMRQIAATISYLPFLECHCSFDILLHTTKSTEVPENWDETENVKIKNSQVVQLKSFSTGIQKVETVVSYKMVED